MWWEAVVYQAIKKNLTDQTYWQVIWDYPGKKNQYAELDVVCQYGHTVLVISCKAYKKVDVQGLHEAALIVRSSASKRFGRFARPLLAIPHNQLAEDDKGHPILEEIQLLTPEILNDEDRLREYIDSFVAQPGTTA